MDIGLVGLGRMGGNMRERIRRAGHKVVGSTATRTSATSTPSPTWSRQLPRPEGRLGHGPGAANRPAPPSTELAVLLRQGDLVIDGGNSRWTDDTPRRAAAEKGIGFVDCGVSGGVWGLENGYALMCGGDDDDVAQGDADLRGAQARGRVRLRARRQGRRRPLHQDGPQRHRVRDHAGLRRGLGAARGGRARGQRDRGLPAPGARAR